MYYLVLQKDNLGAQSETYLKALVPNAITTSMVSTVNLIFILRGIYVLT